MPTLAKIQPMPIGSSSMGSYSLITARAIKVPPTTIMTAFCQVKLTNPWVRMLKTSVKSIRHHSLIADLDESLTVFYLISRMNVNGNNSAGARGANGILHFHRFQFQHFLPLGHSNAFFDEDAVNSAGQGRDDHRTSRRLGDCSSRCICNLARSRSEERL